jgi:hypothetical protein
MIRGILVENYGASKASSGLMQGALRRSTVSDVVKRSANHASHRTLS